MEDLAEAGSEGADQSPRGEADSERDGAQRDVAAIEHVPLSSHV